MLRAGLRLLREKDPERQALLAAIEEGEESGYIEDFDPEAFLESMRVKYGASR